MLEFERVGALHNALLIAAPYRCARALRRVRRRAEHRGGRRGRRVYCCVSLVASFPRALGCGTLGRITRIVSSRDALIATLRRVTPARCGTSPMCGASLPAKVADACDTKPLIQSRGYYCVADCHKAPTDNASSHRRAHRHHPSRCKCSSPPAAAPRPRVAARSGMSGASWPRRSGAYIIPPRPEGHRRECAPLVASCAAGVREAGARPRGAARSPTHGAIVGSDEGAEGRRETLIAIRRAVRHRRARVPGRAVRRGRCGVGRSRAAQRPSAGA